MRLEPTSHLFKLDSYLSEHILNLQAPLLINSSSRLFSPVSALTNSAILLALFSISTQGYLVSVHNWNRSFNLLGWGRAALSMYILSHIYIYIYIFQVKQQASIVLNSSSIKAQCILEYVRTFLYWSLIAAIINSKSYFTEMLIRRIEGGKVSAKFPAPI